MWIEIAAAAYLIGRYVYHRWIKDQPKEPTHSLSVPRTDEGTPIPLIYGRCRVWRPVLIWSGNQVISGDAGGELGPQPFIDLLFVAGIPFQGGLGKLVGNSRSVWFGDRPVFAGVNSDVGGVQDVIIGNNNADGSELNFPGTLVYEGSPTQAFPAALISDADPTLVPDFRNQCLVFMTGTFGVSFDVPSVAFEMESYSVKTAIFPAHLATDACPASVIYDLLTSSWGKLNLPASKIDEPSFSACSVTLLAEQHGYSRCLDDNAEASQIIDDILRQIDGVLYEEPTTGKLVLKLIRQDYVLASMPIVNPDNVLGDLQNFSVGSWRDIMNEVRVTYPSRDNDYNDTTARAQNMANAVGQGNRLRSTTLHFPGVCTPALAQQIAARELAVLSRPTTKCTVRVNREFYATRPGDVVRLTWPKLGLVDMPMRVARVDLGQLYDGAITLDLIHDVFGQTLGAFESPPSTPLTQGTPSPFYDRVVTESPYWLQLYATSEGTLPNADTQRLMGFARPRDASDKFYLESTTAPATPYSQEFPLTRLPYSARVITNYGRELEPYDTATGLEIDLAGSPWESTLVATLGAAWDADGISNFGHSLIVVGSEIMAYETATSLGGTQYRLNNVWRGLLDTAPVDHAEDEIVYWIGPFYGGTNFIGRKGWVFALAGATARLVPNLGILTGSGEDPADAITIAKRSAKPLRVSDLGLAGDLVTGVDGIPVVSGWYKRVTSIEEGFKFRFQGRLRTNPLVVRGDAAGETPESGTSWEVWAQKELHDELASEVSIGAGVGVTDDGSKPAYLLGEAGHGEIDVILHSRRAGALSWQSPRVRVTAARYRNLLANARFASLPVSGSTDLSPGWTGVNAQGLLGTFSLEATAAGAYLTGTSATPATFEQTVEIQGYLPRGLEATLTYYARNRNADADDTCAVTLAALDAAGVSLGTVVDAAFAPPTAAWQRRSVALVLPAGTAKLRVSGTLANVGAGTAPESCVADFVLRLGQLDDAGLANPSFETGGIASWTVGSGAFGTGTAGASPSTTYAQGGASASSTLYQEFALPAGWDVGGSAVVTCWRGTAISGDTGRVTVEVRDSGGAVLATSQTAVEAIALNTWAKRRLAVDIPATGEAAVIRVTLTANRAAGAGLSGALFDEVLLAVHKDLDPAYQRRLSFAEPSIQPTPATWQQVALTFPDLTRPVVFGASSPPIEMASSDGVSRLASKGVGLWWRFSSTVNAYEFARGGHDYRAVGVHASGSQAFANFGAAASFTVVALFRLDEHAFGGACGLVGRRSLTSGWGIEINASGQVTAVLQGTGGTKTVSRPTTVHDGAWHMAALRYDATADTLDAFDERGFTSVSTAAGLGEFTSAALDNPFRIGRSRDAIDPLPGMIARVYVVQNTALTDAEIGAFFAYGEAPAGITHTRNVVAWADVKPDAAGALAASFAVDQLASAYADALVGGSTGYGAAVAKAVTNLVPSWDFAGASYVADVGAVLTQDVVDPTGRPWGVNVAATATAGLKVVGLTFDATATATLVFYARAASGTPSIDIELLNASDVVKDTETVVLSTLWQKFVVSFAGWDASSATARIRWRGDGAPVMFDLGTPLHVSQGTDVPSLLPQPLAAMVDVSLGLSQTLPVQFNAEGEIVVTGVATQASPPTSSLVNVHNGVDDDDRREVLATLAAPVLDHLDAAGAASASSATVIDWTALWTLRARWCAAGLLDDAATPFAGIIADGSVDSDDYGRVATFGYSTVPAEEIQIGDGTQDTPNALIREVVLRAREPKLV